MQLLGDPNQVDVPIEKLLSEEYARETALQVARAIAERHPAPRMHTEGNLSLELEKNGQDNERAKLNAFGYLVKSADIATLSAVGKEDGRFVAGMR